MNEIKFVIVFMIYCRILVYHNKVQVFLLQGINDAEYSGTIWT